MNKLNTVKQAQIVAALVEGNSINATVRMTGAAKHTVLKLLGDLGKACATYQDRHSETCLVNAFSVMKYGVFATPKKRMSLRNIRGNLALVMSGPGPLFVQIRNWYRAG